MAVLAPSYMGLGEACSHVSAELRRRLNKCVRALAAYTISPLYTYTINLENCA